MSGANSNSQHEQLSPDRTTDNGNATTRPLVVAGHPWWPDEKQAEFDALADEAAARRGLLALNAHYQRAREVAEQYMTAMIQHATVWIEMRDAPLHENPRLYDALYQYADKMDALHKELKHLTREIAQKGVGK